MSIFNVGQDYRNTLIFNHMAAFMFETLTEILGCVRFIQVGANDGQTADPVHAFVKSERWIGVLVEPIPAVFARLRDSMSSTQGLDFANCAIGPEDGSATFYACRDPHSPLSSFNKETILKHTEWALSVGLPAPETYIDEIKAPVLTLESLCARYRLDHIDVLVTDTEGFDCKVVCSLDLKQRRPTLIYFEHIHCTSQETLDMRNLLHSFGYELFFDGYNAMAVYCGNIFRRTMISMFREILVDASNLRAK